MTIYSKDDVCKVDDCSRPIYSSWLCSMHYLRFKRRGTVELVERPSTYNRSIGKYQENSICSVSDCQRKPKARGLCKKHYGQFLYAGILPETDCPMIRGPLPGESESAIYFLRIFGGPVFYVGSTTKPVLRATSHRVRFGSDVQMIIIKIVPESDVAFWESKYLVEYGEKFPLENSRTPV